MKGLQFVVVAVLFIVSACDGQMLGQTDEYGCTPSAGYRWCERLGSCVRPFEQPGLAALFQAGELNAAVVDDYCSLKHTQLGSKSTHGCLSSAGYSWCNKLNKCVRPWEIPELSGLYKSQLLTTEHLTAYCEQKVGSVKDQHGCVFTAGYLWCEKLSKCTRPWEVEDLKELRDSNSLTLDDFKDYCTSRRAPLGAADENGCISSAGYAWCQRLNKCVRSWETPELQTLADSEIDAFCTSQPKPSTVGGADAHGCIPSAGYGWCQKLNKCVRTWETPELKSLTPGEISNFCESPEPNLALSTPHHNLGEPDQYGCHSSAGFGWCPKLNKCVRSWETRELKFLSAAEIGRFCFGNATSKQVGGTDNHGCIPSAGYGWCARLNKCVRSWETAELKSLSAVEIFNYCNTEAPTGNKVGVADKHGCVPSAGYGWCHRLKQCVRTWETRELKSLTAIEIDQFCGSENGTRVGGTDKHGCIPSAGYGWCQKLNKCVRSWETPELKSLSATEILNYCGSENSTLLGRVDKHGCHSSAGYAWCQKLNKCVRSWEARELKFLSDAEIGHFCGSENGTRVGGTDKHGCIPSAGYGWCQKLNKCVRSWETPEFKSLKESEIKAFCESNSTTNSITNSTTNSTQPRKKGCIGKAGYTFCQKLDKCVRPWEVPELAARYKQKALTFEEIQEFCEPRNTSSPIGKTTDKDGCLSSAGYSWCAKLSQCVRPWEIPELKTLYAEHKLSHAEVKKFCEASPATTRAPVIVGAHRDLHGCIPSAGYQWCTKLSQCVRAWEIPALNGLYRQGMLTTSQVDTYCGNSN